MATITDLCSLPECPWAAAVCAAFPVDLFAAEQSDPRIVDLAIALVSASRAALLAALASDPAATLVEARRRVLAYAERTGHDPAAALAILEAARG